jgi:hypothetical protein
MSYNPKVLHPYANLIQMRSEWQNPPFFLGGSQVPVDLGLIDPNTIPKSKYDKHLLGYGFVNRKNKIIKQRGVKIHR